jgi:hypothetical protein
MKTKFGLFCLLVIFTMLLTACEIGVTTKVNADGSGEMGAVLKFTKDEATALEGVGAGSADTLCESMSSSGTTGLSSEDMAFTQETHGDEIWCVASKAFASLDEMGQGDETLKVNTAEIKDDKFTLDADFNLGADFDASSLSMVTASGYKIIMFYEIVAPGTIDKTKTEGFDKVNGNTARMTIIDTANDVMPTSGAIHVHLESKLKGGSSGDSVINKKVGGVPVWGIVVAVCCCLLLVVIVVVVLFFVMRKKPKQPGM